MTKLTINDLEIEVDNIGMANDSEGKSISFSLNLQKDNEISKKLMELCFNILLKGEKVKVSIDNYTFDDKFFLACSIDDSKNTRYFDIELYTLK